MHTVITQPPLVVPRTSPEDPLKVLTSGNHKGPLGDSQGTSLEHRVLFTGKTNIQTKIAGIRETST